MKVYFPYKSDKPEKKFYIITKTGKKIYFGDSKYEHFTMGHLDWARRQRYEDRHKKNENWNDQDSASYWAYRYLWLYPTYIEAYDKIKKDLKSKGLL